MRAEEKRTKQNRTEQITKERHETNENRMVNGE